ncbi:MAG: methyl-accepting chemotaxis protein [Gammaproteobacteria bacterium]|jgi:methyl-accepting chemotaxis protein
MIRFIGSSLRNKLIVITGSGTVLLLGSSLYGLWVASSGLHDIAHYQKGHTSLPAIQAIAQHAEDRISLSMALMGVAIVISFIWFMYFMRRSILRPTAALVQDLQRLADGDFTHSVEVITRDELGRIAESAGGMQRHLGSMIGQVRDAADEVCRSVLRLREITESTESSLSQQDMELDQVATAMNQMAATSQEVSRHAADTAKATHDAQELSHQGALASTSAMTGIDSLVGRVRKAVELIGRVEKQTEDISKILEVITQITEQTNLLALNAAIEAARAGEQGRGFAVVADEVRSLANRTRSSTAEIQTMIEGLQGGAREAVEFMAHVREDADRSEQQVEEAAESLGEIAHAIKTIDTMSTQIATAAEEQRAVSEEVNNNLLVISEGIGKLRTSSMQAAEESRHQERLSIDVTQIMERFRLDDKRD